VNSRLVLIVAGEASADLHGSHLVTTLKRLDPGLTFSGIGGPRMEEAGVRILFSSAEMAVVGLTEVVSRLVTVTRAYLRLKTILRKGQPVLLILMDYPDFNLRLARAAKRCQVPVLYYISPQVWAWRKGRVETIRRCVDRMAVILPFEKDFYREEDSPSTTWATLSWKRSQPVWMGKRRARNSALIRPLPCLRSCREAEKRK